MLQRPCVSLWFWRAVEGCASGCALPCLIGYVMAASRWYLPIQPVSCVYRPVYWWGEWPYGLIVLWLFYFILIHYWFLFHWLVYSVFHIFLFSLYCAFLPHFLSVFIRLSKWYHIFFAPEKIISKRLEHLLILGSFLDFFAFIFYSIS